jgi:rhodanese-related sulfurtransferase
MSHRQFKERIYSQFARVGHALANDRRLELLDLLAQGPRHVDALSGEMGIPVANVSQHLQVLRNARLVESDREGTRVIYRLADEGVLRLWLALRSVAESRLAEVRQIVEEFAIEGAKDSTLPRSELRELIRTGEVFLIDVRPTLEYEYGHLPGAVSMPVDELPQRLGELPEDKRIVAYCRGSYCLFADEAVALLREKGYDVSRMEGGWEEWWVEERPAVDEGS